MKRYNPKEIEPKWQKTWEVDGIYRASEDTTKPKRYVLEYFPYPSGAAMHVGHVRNYTIGDVVARFSRMRGNNVLHPMGWDAFGLPAENYAIKNNISPQQAIAQNTSKFKQQLTQMGFSYDWSREINSSDPGYYKWTQYFFTLLFERGLAYQKESLQWWCETDKTVLANEQVEAGRCWRCGNEVTKKPLKQWFFKITDYADRLVKDLDDLDWSDSIKSMQRNWIGKSKGAEIDFAIEGYNELLKVFTTRPDTLFGATFIVLAPEHPLVEAITTKEQQKAIGEYIKQTQTKSDIERQETDREKTGVFTGVYAINPVNNSKIPIWISDYVLYGYGTGAIMAVPAHDGRDYEFALKFNLPIINVVEPRFGKIQGDEIYKEAIIAVVRNPKTQKVIVLDWGPRKENYGGNLLIGGGIEEGENPIESAKREIIEETGYKNFKHIKTANSHVNNYFYSTVKHKNYHARFLPMLFELVNEERVEQKLDENENQFEIRWKDEKLLENEITDEAHLFGYKLLQDEVIYNGEGILINSGQFNGLSTSDAREKIVADLAKKNVGTEKDNYKIRDWLISRQRYWGAPIPIIHCPDDGAVPVPKDQLPVVLPEVESYQPTGEGASILASVKDWVNVDCPKCDGPAMRETDTMDGFACSSWYFLRFTDPSNNNEPFDSAKAKFWLPVDDYIGGAEHAVMHLLYARMWTKVMYDAGLIEFNEPFKSLRNQGMILAPDGRKMSKSWGNVIAPDELIEQGYGADSVRIMELFIGPWDQEASWSVEGMGGCFRFLQRVWTLAYEYIESGKKLNGPLTCRTMHHTIKKVSQDLHSMSFNTAVAAMMECTNELYKVKSDKGFESKDWGTALSVLSQLLAPFAPHIAEELWQELGNEGSVHMSEWPVHDDKYLASDTMIIVVQINGKVRANLELVSDLDEKLVIEAATSNEKIAGLIGDNEIKKAIYVKGRLVNLVV